MRHCTCCDRSYPDDHFVGRKHVCDECRRANGGTRVYTEKPISRQRIGDGYAASLRRAMNWWLKLWDGITGDAPRLWYREIPGEIVEWINSHPNDFGYKVVRNSRGRADVMPTRNDGLEAAGTRLCEACGEYRPIEHYSRLTTICSECLTTVQRARRARLTRDRRARIARGRATK